MFNAEVFTTFKGVIEEAHRLLQDYWATPQNQGLSNADRTKLSRGLVDRLDATLGYGEFLDELSACIEVHNLLKQADAAPKQS